MSKKIIHYGIKFALLPFVPSYLSADKIEHTTKTEQSIQLSDAKPESGWDRVKKMFELDEFGNISQEANSVLQATCMSLLVGGVYGGTMQGKAAYEQFMRNNEATTFKTHLEAKKKLQDAVTLGFGKGAFKWGWRLALFSSSYVAVSTITQLYRGKYGIMEYVGAGAVTGFLYKFNAGPRGWVVGSGLGMVLGLICGGTTLGILKVSGISMEEARYWQYKWKDSRNEYLRKGREKYLETQDFPVVKLHNDEVGEAGKSIFNLDKDSDTKVDDKNVK